MKITKIIQDIEKNLKEIKNENEDIKNHKEMDIKKMEEILEHNNRNALVNTNEQMNEE